MKITMELIGTLDNLDLDVILPILLAQPAHAVKLNAAFTPEELAEMDAVGQKPAVEFSFERSQVEDPFKCTCHGHVPEIEGALFFMGHVFGTHLGFGLQVNGFKDPKPRETAIKILAFTMLREETKENKAHQDEEWLRKTLSEILDKKEGD